VCDNYENVRKASAKITPFKMKIFETSLCVCFTYVMNSTIEMLCSIPQIYILKYVSKSLAIPFLSDERKFVQSEYLVNSVLHDWQLGLYLL
jgi:hypothetical protein